jgi:hypothetical protein
VTKLAFIAQLYQRRTTGHKVNTQGPPVPHLWQKSFQ